MGLSQWDLIKECLGPSYTQEESLVTFLTPEASTRRYFRITLKKEPNFSKILCLYQKGEEDSFERYREMSTFLHQKKVAIPKILTIVKKSLAMVLEDLGEVHALDFLIKASQEKRASFLSSCVKEILLPYHQTQKEEVPNSCVSRILDSNFMEKEIEKTLDFFPKAFNKELKKDEKEEIFLDFQKLFLFLEKVPKVWTHRDFHSRNLLFLNNKIICIDFQDSLWAPYGYDLVSLLEDCYFSHAQVHKQEIIDLFWSSSEQKEQSILIYSSLALQRLFKAVGSLCFVFVQTGNPKFLPAVGVAMEKIRCILESKEMNFFELNGLKHRLLNYYYKV